MASVTHLLPLRGPAVPSRVSSPVVRGLPFVLPIALVVGLFVTTGIRGVDFGTHWDEVSWQVNPVRDMVASGLLLPRASIYPSVAEWLILLPAVPAGVRTAGRSGTKPRDAQAAMLAVLNRPDYLLTVRSLFIVLSALAIVWVYAATLALRRPWWEALLAACGLGLSWEYAYHARWVATDCLVVQFSALTLFFIAMFFRAGRRGWLYAAAIAAGLGTGAKFPGVVLVVPVAMAGALALSPRDWRRQLRRLVALGATAAGAYLISTPATFMDPFTFAEQLAWISDHYKHGHYMHTVSGPWHHLGLVFTYLAVSYFSPFEVAAVLLFAAVIGGAVVWARRSRRAAVILIGFPIAFLAFFCFRYNAMIARNYLLTVPFLCVLMAGGIADLYDRLGRRWVRATLAGGLAALALAQGAFLIWAAESIRHLDPDAEVRDAMGFVRNHPKLEFRVSAGVRARATAQQLPMPANVVSDHALADAVVLFPRAEGPDSFSIATNDPWLTMAVFGPREVNFNWYSGWWGHDRVVVMTKAKAQATGVALAQ